MASACQYSNQPLIERIRVCGGNAHVTENEPLSGINPPADPPKSAAVHSGVAWFEPATVTVLLEYCMKLNRNPVTAVQVTSWEAPSIE